jgi:RHS repeat-associated protein
VAATVSYSCPPGYTLSGSTCSSSTSTAATATYDCRGLGTPNASGICVGYGVLAYSYYEAYDLCEADGSSHGLALNSVDLVSGKRYNCTYQADVRYSCPNGGTLSGAQCVASSSQPANATYSCSAGTLSGTQCAVPQNYAATASYTCPNGGTLSNSTCVKTAVHPATAGYTCPNGGSLSGTTCQKTTTYPATATYSCPNGGTVSGSSCIQTSTYPATASYTCNAGDSLSGSTCTRTTSTAATATYSCPNGGTLSGSQCSGTMTTKTAYVYLGGKQIAETVVGGATQYVHTDALGSPVAHTDQGGAVLNRTKFEPYGYTAAGTKPGPTMTGFTTTGSAIGFTGHVNDPDTDLVYMQQRYYDPIAGRFLSVDPVVTDANDGGSINRYNYANNSPYKYVDPDGRQGINSVLQRAAKLGAEKLIARRAWRKGEVEGVRKDATGTDGVTRCTTCGQPTDKLDMGHQKKWGETQHEIMDRVEAGESVTRKEVLEVYGKDVKGQCVPCNRGDNKLMLPVVIGVSTTAAGTAQGAVVTIGSDYTSGEIAVKTLELIIDLVVSPTEAGDATMKRD